MTAQYQQHLDLTPIVSFSFSATSDAWVPHNKDQDATTKRGEGSIRLATLNVLHDNNTALREYFLQSPKRTAHMIQLVTDLEPDIICLNEVTVNILHKILQNAKIRSLYYVSENMCIHERCPFGNILLSKLPFMEVYSYQLKEATCKRKVIFGSFSANQLQFVVGGAHITAYDNNAHIRKVQIEEITSAVNRNFGENVFLMGDFNFHHERENKYMEDEYLDLWKETHDTLAPSTVRSLGSLLSSYVPYSSYLFPATPASDEDGYTFDSHTNLFISYYIPLERRRMRLDRIVMKKGSNFECSDKMHRFATEPVEPNSYLFTSDHYGLYVDVTTTNKSKY